MTVGQSIRTCRERRKMTQGELAKLAGCTKTAIYFWETERCLPNMIYAVQIADVLDVTLDELIGRSVSKNAESIQTITR